MAVAAPMRAKVNHKPDQGTVTQAGRRADVDAIQHLARLAGIEHRGLAAFDHVLGAAHRARWVERQDAAGGKPVEQHADRGQVPLHGRRRLHASEVLDVSGDMNRREKTIAIIFSALLEGCRREYSIGERIKLPM
jgi:hypothetical protein